MGILKKSKATKAQIKIEQMDLLLKNFGGEQVEIVVDKDLDHPIGEEDVMHIIRIPLTVTGFLTDIDDQFVYLGQSVNQISQAVSKDFIIHIGIMDESSVEIDGEGKVPAGKFN